MANKLPNSTYISCIRINGVPILPPIITPEKRLEIQKYKLKAIELENRIKIRSAQEKLTNTLNKTLEHSLAFNQNNALTEFDKCDLTLPKNVPLEQTKSSQLSCNIFDVTEYNDEGIILFNEENGSKLQLTAGIVELDLASDKIETTSTSSHPNSRRLLRSNSYTLEAPSPVLMEHFKEHLKNQNDSHKYTDSKPLTLSYSSGDSNFNSIHSIIPKNGLLTDSIGDLIKDLACIHFGNQSEINLKLNEVDKRSDSYNIEEFLGGQGDDLLVNFNDNVNLKIATNDCNYNNCNGNISNSLDNSSYTAYYSTDSVTEALDPSSIQLIDFESETCDNLTPCFSDINNEEMLIDFLSGTPNKSVDKRKACARELFTDVSGFQNRLREDWAATVLTSAARGYLVRRLKRTERVKNLIQTISDALLCAMSLHSEKSDMIQPSDVELHRRLIQQISAACFEIHDIFFNMTTKEQMEIISLDRQRLQEKLKRPSSTSSSKIDSDRSSRSQRNSLHIKQKKPLVTSLVA